MTKTTSSARTFSTGRLWLRKPALPLKSALFSRLSGCSRRVPHVLNMLFRVTHELSGAFQPPSPPRGPLTPSPYETKSRSASSSRDFGAWVKGQSLHDVLMTVLRKHTAVINTYARANFALLEGPFSWLYVSFLFSVSLPALP